MKIESRNNIKNENFLSTTIILGLRIIMKQKQKIVVITYLRERVLKISATILI